MTQNTCIGLDVHAQTVAACTLDPTTGEIVRASMNHDPYTVMSWIRGIGNNAQVVYESGPTGFGLARYLRAQGIDCCIAASSKLLKAPGHHIKTDKKDALSLARMLCLDQVTRVWIPTEEQEALRDFSRARMQAAKSLSKARQHINALLLRHGIRYPEPTKWTLKHMNWLRHQHLEQTAAQWSLDALLEEAEFHAAHLKRLDARIKQISENCQYTKIINALMCFRGFDITTAYGLATEIGDWTRLTGKTIGAYLGLVPSEHSSGTTRAQGSITKAGNSYARRLLVEAAWQHARPFGKPGLRLSRQMDLVDPATRLRAMEGNRRLYRVWQKFDERGKKRTKANTAVARENWPAGSGRWRYHCNKKRPADPRARRRRHPWPELLPNTYPAS